MEPSQRVVYEVGCADCDKLYVGQTLRATASTPDFASTKMHAALAQLSIGEAHPWIEPGPRSSQHAEMAPLTF